MFLGLFVKKEKKIGRDEHNSPIKAGSNIGTHHIVSVQWKLYAVVLYICLS